MVQWNGCSSGPLSDGGLYRAVTNVTLIAVDWLVLLRDGLLSADVSGGHLERITTIKYTILKM